jgi:outer membrane lipoprotein
MRKRQAKAPGLSVVTKLRLVLIMFAILLVAGCATSPVAPDGAQIAPIGPAHVLAEEGHEGEQVIWGGRIVQVDNYSDHTALSVVSYPLDRADRPRVNSEAGVRFLVVEPGFLEPVEFAPGRFVTVLGRVGEIEEQAVGEYLYDHPVLHAEQIHLWPVDRASWQQRTGFSFGVGIRL